MLLCRSVPRKCNEEYAGIEQKDKEVLERLKQSQRQDYLHVTPIPAFVKL